MHFTHIPINWAATVVAATGHAQHWARTTSFFLSSCCPLSPRRTFDRPHLKVCHIYQSVVGVLQWLKSRRIDIIICCRSFFSHSFPFLFLRALTEQHKFPSAKGLAFSFQFNLSKDRLIAGIILTVLDSTGHRGACLLQ